MLLYIRGTSKRLVSGLLGGMYVPYECVGFHYFKVRVLYELGI